MKVPGGGEPGQARAHDDDLALTVDAAHRLGRLPPRATLPNPDSMPLAWDAGPQRRCEHPLTTLCPMSDDDLQAPLFSLPAQLTPSQREAILCTDPLLCVLAGAGSGKTRVLTLRVARRVF